MFPPFLKLNLRIFANVPIFSPNLLLCVTPLQQITLLRVIPTMTFIHFVTGKSSGILSDIFSGIRSGILSGISSGILPGISSGRCSGISSGISSGILSGKSSGIPSGILSSISSGILSGKSAGFRCFQMARPVEYPNIPTEESKKVERYAKIF